MSDQGSVNPLFNRQLGKLKESLLPEVYSNWDTLNEDVRTEIKDTSSFFCKMHVIVNMDTEADKCLVLFESNFSSRKNQNAFG